jgi:hypothetical protein
MRRTTKSRPKPVLRMPRRISANQQADTLYDWLLSDSRYRNPWILHDFTKKQK